MNWSLLMYEFPWLTASFVLIGCYLSYYFTCIVQRPLLACRQGAWRNFLEENLPVLQERYWPTPWCVDGRLQTILAYILRYSLPKLDYERETLHLKDGGILSMDWASRPVRKDQPILIILPGLTGSSQSEYIKGYFHSLKDLDFCKVIFNHRGMSNTELKTSRAYCGANSDDFEEALEHIHSLYPGSPLVANGISLGGMVLGNYLATRGTKASKFLRAAVVFSVPWNLFVCSDSLETPFWNLFINKALTRALHEIFRSFKEQLSGDHPWSYHHLMESKTIREFDDRFTSLNFGYRNVDEYYKAASLDDKLHKIRVPFVCLTAADDPFLPMKGIPMEKANQSSHVAIIVTSRGGHVGFMEGLFPYKTYFGDRFLNQYLKGVFSNLERILEIRKEGDDFIMKS